MPKPRFVANTNVLFNNDRDNFSGKTSKNVTLLNSTETFRVKRENDFFVFIKMCRAQRNVMVSQLGFGPASGRDYTPFFVFRNSFVMFFYFKRLNFFCFLKTNTIHCADERLFVRIFVCLYRTFPARRERRSVRTTKHKVVFSAAASLILLVLTPITSRDV